MIVAVTQAWYRSCRVASFSFMSKRPAIQLWYADHAQFAQDSKFAKRTFGCVAGPMAASPWSSRQSSHARTRLLDALDPCTRPGRTAVHPVEPWALFYSRARDLLWWSKAVSSNPSLSTWKPVATWLGLVMQSKSLPNSSPCCGRGPRNGGTARPYDRAVLSSYLNSRS